MKEYIKKNKFNILIMIIYSVITLVTIIFHENWRDEAQSWLIARDLNCIDIFKQMRYEGHPCLWHLLIAPFAKLGFPYITQNIIAWAILNITAILILKESPFDKIIKALILFSAPFIYFYPAIARSYCLIPLAIVLIAITYKNRKDKPFRYVLSITLLAHTHILMLGLVGMLYLFFFFEEIFLQFNKKTKEERRRILLSLLVATLGLLLLFMQLCSSLDSNATIQEDLTINNSKIKFTFIVLLNILSKILGNTNYIFICFAIVMTMFVFMYKFIKCKKTTLIILGGIGFQLFVYVFIHSDLSYQKTLTSLLILIFGFWIDRYEISIHNNKKYYIFLDVYLNLILMFNCILGANSVIREIKYNYSAAKQTATYINENIEENNETILIASHVPISSSIIPYTEFKNYWSPQLNKFFAYTEWNEENENQNNIPVDRIINNIDSKFKDKKEIYFIYCYNWAETDIQAFTEKTNAKELFRSESDLIQEDEKYIIYKLYNK